MENLLISIVVPVYNSSEYLDKCIQSLIDQDYKFIEIIIVDDGSTDNSLSICTEWAKTDNRIKLISTKNFGQASARNTGVKNACGEYVMFVDSDDWIEKNTISSIAIYATDKKYDVICFANDSSKRTNSGSITIFKQPEIMLEHLRSNPGTGHSPCDKLIKKSILIKNPFPNLKAYEDAATMYKIFADSKTILYIDTVFYHYSQRENSVMHHSFSESNFLSINVYYDMFLYYSASYPYYSKYVKRILLGAIQYCVGEYGFSNKNKKIVAAFDHAMCIIKSLNYSNLNLKNFICLYLIKHHPKLYWRIYASKYKK